MREERGRGKGIERRDGGNREGGRERERVRGKMDGMEERGNKGEREKGKRRGVERRDGSQERKKGREREGRIEVKRERKR